jgi:hypothetical protein
MSTVVEVPTISRQQAIAIAEADALPMYGARILDSLMLCAVLHEDGWHIEYRQWRFRHTGSGPHYVIDATTGAIVTKRYYQ